MGKTIRKQKNLREGQKHINARIRHCEHRNERKATKLQLQMMLKTGQP